MSDRLWLAHAIWESVGEDELPGELSDTQKEDLGRRMRELDENPSIGLTWDQLMEGPADDPPAIGGRPVAAAPGAG